MPNEIGQWAEAEGLVTFVGKKGDGISLELSSGSGHMPVTVVEADDALILLLRNSRIRVDGLCVGVHSGINGEMMGSVAVPDQNHIAILQVPPEIWQRYPLQSISDVIQAPSMFAGKIVHLHGLFRGTNNDGTLGVVDGADEISIQCAQSPPKPGALIEALGVASPDETRHVLKNGVFQLMGKRTRASLPLLTSTEQVRWLKPEEAAKRYPVKVRAVVTFLLSPPNPPDGNIEDGTGGIYTWNLVPSDGNSVQPGDYCEIEGDTSAGEFSPGIYCHKVKILGRGQFPEPVRPSWNELASGSLDAQWVEMEGVVMSATNHHMEIGAQGGRVSCYVGGGNHLEAYLNAIVQVRGVVVADWDQARHVQGLHLNLPSEEFVSLELPPLEQPFSLPTKRIKELLYYDPGQSAFRREKIRGQVIGARGDVCYVTDGANGLRLWLEQHQTLMPGDMVEAVGFPEIDNSTPTPLITLHEAMVRVTSREPMPSPVMVAPTNVLDSRLDSTLVRLDAQLVRSSIYGAENILELQAGARTFFARLDKAAGKTLAAPAGSRVEVTGVYVFNNGPANGRPDIGPFDMLLNSPADVSVLEMPSWWTNGHALMVVSGMSVVILLALVWIGLLRQQVGRRTAQLSAANLSLEAEIAERKRAENELVRTRLQHLLEQERTRIARDIHDELGSSLSQIRLLSEMTLAQNNPPPHIHDNCARISSKALEATRVLDEIVWAVDPHNDTLESLATYLFNFASDYLSLAGVRFRIDAPTQMPHHSLNTQIRHQLYMAVKETLTNIVNHAQASEVWIRLRLENGAAVFVVEDNGRGFDLSRKSDDSPGASGLQNMRKRFNEIGGEFNLDSAPGRGTRVKFVLHLKQEAKP